MTLDELKARNRRVLQEQLPYVQAFYDQQERTRYAKAIREINRRTEALERGRQWKTREWL